MGNDECCFCLFESPLGLFRRGYSKDNQKIYQITFKAKGSLLKMVDMLYIKKFQTQVEKCLKICFLHSS